MKRGAEEIVSLRRQNATCDYACSVENAVRWKLSNVWITGESMTLADVLVGAAQILDVVKQEWGESWSEFDQSIRDGISAELTRIYDEPRWRAFRHHGRLYVMRTIPSTPYVYLHRMVLEAQGR